MRLFVLDTNIFSDMIINKPDHEVFQNLWLPLEHLIENSQIVSAREVYEELKKRIFSSKKSYNSEWLKKRKDLFITPDNEVCSILREMYNKFPKFKEGIKPSAFKNGNPSADGFIVALAKKLNATVVSAEEYKPNSEKIPFMCQKMDVEFMSKNDFYRYLNNMYKELGD